MNQVELTPAIGTIKRVPLREVWAHEALDFTRWLQENIEALNDVLDFPLSSAEREQSAGTFSVDLVAEDQSGNVVVVENQLEKSDHDHLGKLLTYMVAFDAQTAIRIVKDPRPEHVSVINWLNESGAAAFYLIKLEAIRIGDSAPAPLFTRIVGPSEEARQVGETKKDLAERHHIRREFWQELLDRANVRTRLHANISPSTDNWISTGAGKAGLSFPYVVLQHNARVELAIDTGDGEENKRIFDQLHQERTAIEEAFDDALEWDWMEGRRACYIRYYLEDGGYRDRERWPEIQDRMIEAMIRLERALRPYLTRLS